MLYDDPEFIKSKITVMRMILQYFAKHERADGTVSSGWITTNL
jgi:hypothetical protein